MEFDVMLQSCVNRGAVTDETAGVDRLLNGAHYDHDENKWMIEIDTFDQLRKLAGVQTIALRFESESSPDDHLLIIEDDLDG